MNPLDEPVTLVPYDPKWPEIYDQERFRIALAFGVFPSSGLLQHIGSTAVPGMISKPVVDLMLGVREWPPPNKLLRGVCGLGYENMGEAGVAERVYLRCRSGQHFNAHVVARGGAHWTNNLALRELLLRDPAAREKYSAAKIAAITKGSGRLIGYSEAKQEIMNELIAKARAMERCQAPIPAGNGA
jgi:GrpB-like predicted nucleotidyltransferase (UPF0157 family)